MSRVYVDQNMEAAAYSTTKTPEKSAAASDEIGRYRFSSGPNSGEESVWRENREEVQKRKKRDSLYLLLSSVLDLFDTALILFLLIFVWRIEYYGVLLAGVILSILFVGCKVAFAVLVYKKMQGFWSKPWSPFAMDVISAFVPGCVIPLFVMAAATGFLPDEANCNYGEVEWAVGIICFAKVAESGAYGGLAWLTDLCTGRGCICVCDLFDCSDCSVERVCEYFLRTMCDKVIVAVRILCAVLVLVFGIIQDHDIADMCSNGNPNNVLSTAAPVTSIIPSSLAPTK